MTTMNLNELLILSDNNHGYAHGHNQFENEASHILSGHRSCARMVANSTANLIEQKVTMY